MQALSNLRRLAGFALTCQAPLRSFHHTDAGLCPPEIEAGCQALPAPLPVGETGGQSVKGGEAGNGATRSVASMARTHPLTRRWGQRPQSSNRQSIGLLADSAYPQFGLSDSHS